MLNIEGLDLDIKEVVGDYNAADGVHVVAIGTTSQHRFRVLDITPEEIVVVDELRDTGKAPAATMSPSTPTGARCAAPSSGPRTTSSASSTAWPCTSTRSAKPAASTLRRCAASRPRPNAAAPPRRGGGGETGRRARQESDDG